MAVGTGAYRVTGRNEVFVLENNKWRYVCTEAVLFQAGYSWADVQVIDTQFWCQYEVGSPMPGGWADPSDYGYCPHKDWYVAACAVVPPPPPPPPTYPCPSCPDSFGSQAELDAHIAQAHPPVPPPPNGHGVPANIHLIAWPVSLFGSESTIRATFQLYQDIGINAIMHYRHQDDYKNDPAAMAKYDQVYNLAAEYGLKVYWYVDNRADYKNPNNGQTFVGRYKDFPACAGWLYADEPHCWHTWQGESGWPEKGGHALAKMLYGKIRALDPDIANHPAFAVWDKGPDHLCGDPPVWTSTYNLIYTPGGEIIDVGSTDVYPGGNNWAMLDTHINFSYRFPYGKGDGYGELGKGMIPVIDAFTDGAMLARNLLTQCEHWQAKYGSGISGIRGIAFWHPGTWGRGDAKGANLREQIKEVARSYGWQERAEEVITPQTIIHSCAATISYNISSWGENNNPLNCPHCGLALEDEGIKGSEEIVHVPEVITPEIVICSKCGSKLKLSVSSFANKNIQQYCPVCSEPAD